MRRQAVLHRWLCEKLIRVCLNSENTHLHLLSLNSPENINPKFESSSTAPPSSALVDARTQSSTYNNFSAQTLLTNFSQSSLTISSFTNLSNTFSPVKARSSQLSIKFHLRSHTFSLATCRCSKVDSGIFLPERLLKDRYEGSSW